MPYPLVAEVQSLVPVLAQVPIGVRASGRVLVPTRVRVLVPVVAQVRARPLLTMRKSPGRWNRAHHRRSPEQRWREGSAQAAAPSPSGRILVSDVPTPHLPVQHF